MKTPDKPPESDDKDEASERPMERFRRNATVVMSTSVSRVKAAEALEAKKRRKAKESKD